MDLTAAEAAVAATVRDADVVDPTGSGTHREVGGPPPTGTEVRAPAAIVSYDPAELTVTVGAGTTVEELTAVLAEAGQECPLDPRDPAATVGGTLATGLSGPRRLRYGPLRDRVLEVRFASAGGDLVRGGGPTVKNVTGYDLPRLLVGSFGTIGVLTRVILRCQPRPVHVQWMRSERDPDDIRRASFRSSAVLWDGETTWVLLEGHENDVIAEVRRLGLEPAKGEATWPIGMHRGRASVAPAQVQSLGRALADLDRVHWLGESGVGTVHVATDDSTALAAARSEAERHGGWLLREAGAPDLDGFGVPLANLPVMTRIKEAFDPEGKLAPGRLPFARREAPVS